MTPAYHILGAGRPSRWIVSCDHASNRVPEEVGGGTLGLPDDEMGRHIAYDVGAAGVTRRLADLLDAPAILSDVSRLVIDPNRGEDDPTLIMKLYDGTLIPGNRTVGAEETEARLEAYHRPYHRALGGLMERPGAALLAIHSFTPRLNGRHPRPWHVGVLHAGDDPLSRALIGRLEAEGDLCVGDNEPYAGHLPGDSIDRHALAHGRPNVLIEIRNDLIGDEAGQAHWAGRLALVLDGLLDAA